MSALVQAVLRARRFARFRWPVVAVAIVGFFTLRNGFSPVDAGPSNGQLLVGAVLLLSIVGAVFPRLRHSKEQPSDLEFGLLLLMFVYATIQATGGLESGFYPLVYLVIAFAASFMAPFTAGAVTLFALVFEFVLHFVTEVQTDAKSFALHVVLMVLFAALNLLFTRAEIVRVRSSSRLQIEKERAKTRDETRMFRLVAPAAGGLRNDEKLHQSSVEEVHQALYYVLQLLHRTLELHTVILLMPSSDGKNLGVAELVTKSEGIAEGPFSIGAGAVGAALKQRMVTSLADVKPGYRGICYYREPAEIRSFIAVPIVEGGSIRGVLCADRLENRAFTSAEEQVLLDSVHHILRAIENERVFLQLERSKNEKDILHRASQALGTALDSDAVMDAGLQALAEIAPYDFAALTEYQLEGRKHSIARAVGEQAERFKGLRFRDNHSLTAMAVKNMHYLPYRGEYDSEQQIVFTKRANLKDMRSMFVVPLVVREEPIGALVLAAHRENAFGDAVRPTLQVLANQLAAAMANAAAVKRLEQLATIDALTGCLNKRAFMEALDNKILAAERFQRKLSLVVTDLDHFKSINDTYGHASGDRVLRELGQILRGIKRETDIVGRFGGEEFCILCEETDTKGAIQLAERVREELGKMKLTTEMGDLQVTASLGVATFPNHARTSEELFEVSDKALYFAKEHGRDRVCAA